MPFEHLLTDRILILESLADLGGLLRAGSDTELRAISVLLCGYIVVSLWTHARSIATKGGKLLLRGKVLVLVVELRLRTIVTLGVVWGK